MWRSLFEGIRNQVYRANWGYLIKPKLLVYEVTRQCNSRCVHCDIWKQDSPRNLLTPQEVEIMLRDSLFNDLRHVILTGGEPSLRRDIFDVIQAFHRHDPSTAVWFSTNALLPHRILGIAKKSVEQGVKLGVGISLDAVGSENDNIRGITNSFRKSDKLLRNLKKIGITPSLGFTLSEKTIPYYYDVEAYAQQNHVPLIVQKFDSASFYGHRNFNAHTNDGERQIVERLPDGLLKEHWLRRLNGDIHTFDCYALHSFFVLHCDGKVSPCLRRYHQTFGNIRENTPTQIWRSSKMVHGRWVVKNCRYQCLNDWAFKYSVQSSYLPVLGYRLRHMA